MMTIQPCSMPAPAPVSCACSGAAAGAAPVPPIYAIFSSCAGPTLTRRTGMREAAMFEEFKKFALRGNVVDLAIGIIIGAAFTRIVESLVGDVFMPVIGAVTGGLDFSNHFFRLSSAVTADSLPQARTAPCFLASASESAVNQLWRQEEKKPSPPPRQEVLLEEIRDILAKKSTSI